MPKAPVNEDHGVMLGKNQIWPPMNLAGMEPETKAARMEGMPESQLWFRVFCPYPRHHSGAGLLVYDIDHLRPGFSAQT
jgi:hypothetical protein